MRRHTRRADVLILVLLYENSMSKTRRAETRPRLPNCGMNQKETRNIPGRYQVVANFDLIFSRKNVSQKSQASIRVHMQCTYLSTSVSKIVCFFFQEGFQLVDPFSVQSPELLDVLAGRFTGGISLCPYVSQLPTMAVQSNTLGKPSMTRENQCEDRYRFALWQRLPLFYKKHSIKVTSHSWVGGLFRDAE